MKNINISWSCQSRIDTIDFPLLKLMKKAGCWRIGYGIESGSDKILKVLNKGITTDVIKNTLSMTKKVGLRIWGYFMVANILETKVTLQESYKFLLNNSIDDFHITYFTPFHGSPAYIDIHKYGRFKENWNKMTTMNLVFIPNTVKKRIIKKYVRLMYFRFYFRKKTIISNLKIIGQMNFIHFLDRSIRALLSVFLKILYG